MVALVLSATTWAAPAALPSEGPKSLASKETDTEESVSALVPPRQLGPVDPQYPEAALVDGPAGEVVLAVTIDTRGRVTAVEVTQALDPRLDEAAREAAFRLEFEPARRGDTPIASRVRVAFSFEPPAETQAEPEVVTGRVEGTVILPDGSAPVVGAKVRLVAPEGTRGTTRTDVEGHFIFEDLPEGTYSIHAEGLDIGSAEVHIRVE